MKESNKVDILVKAYANMNGLSSFLHTMGILKDKEQFRAFAAGFSCGQPLFEFVDVGPGKERADHKIRGKSALEIRLSCLLISDDREYQLFPR